MLPAAGLAAAACALVGTTVAVGADEGVAPLGGSAPAIGLTELGRYQGQGAEISAYDPGSKRLFVTDAGNARVDILDLTDPASPDPVGSIDTTPYGAGPTSVAVRDGIIAVAVPADPATEPGKVVFFTPEGSFLGEVTAGSLPDMVTFTPDGRYVLAANEGEPSEDLATNPEGSVSIIDLAGGPAQATVVNATFERFNSKKSQLQRQGVVFGPGPTVAQDVEPEYVTVDRRSRTAWVTLQENNAIAFVDIKRARVQDIRGLGFKDHAKPGNPFDASDRDDAIRIENWPAYGMYQPDAIASFTTGGKTYLLSANEGDAGVEDALGVERVEDLTLDPAAFPNAAELQLEENLGRLEVTPSLGDRDGDGDFDALYHFGARSFSVWSDTGRLVYDSGAILEEKTAELVPAFFNSQDGDPEEFDARSDAKGPEPEGLALGEIRGRTYAFVGLERIGGIMTFDVTNPRRPVFQDYEYAAYLPPAGESPSDVSPEGVLFISASQSPTGAPLLVVANEVSFTTTIYAVGA